MIDALFRGDFVTAPMNVSAMMLGLLLAFACGHALAWIYMYTHTGLSYSRSFVNSLIVIPTVVALVMMVLTNSLVTAFGMMAIFAIVRFRNILRDTLDTTYVLSALVIGMASGSLKFSTAIIGCGVIILVMFYLWFTAFGSRHRYDMILNLHWARSVTDLNELRNLLFRHSLRSTCASQRSSEGYEGTDISYRLLLRDPDRMDELLMELRALQGVSRVTGLKAEEESEV
jgi:hypothetical protein